MTVAAGNTITLFLSGAGVPGLTVLLNNQALAAGQTIPFNSVPVGSSQTIALMLANQTNACSPFRPSRPWQAADLPLPAPHFRLPAYPRVRPPNWM